MEEEEEEGGGSVACSQSVTEIERFPETEAEGESTKQGWGPSAETEVAGKTEGPAHRREQRRGKEEESGG